MRSIPAYTLVLIAALLLVVAVLVVRQNHADAQHQQRIADCVIATGDTWAQCSKFTP